jgi:hypothetical protein
MKFLKIAGAAIILAGSLSACGGAKCLETEMRWHMVPVYNSTTKTTTMQMQWYPHCLRYEEVPE